MASLYKKPVRIKDPQTGKLVQTKSKKWWGRYRDHLGIDRRVPLARDKTAAQAMLNELILKAERRAAGQVDPWEDHLKRPIKDHIDDFRLYLEYKGNPAEYASQLSTRVRKVVTGCKWRSIGDISPGHVQQYLAERRQDKGGKKGIAIQTSNHYLKAIKQFSRWLARDRRCQEDRLVHLATLNASVDRRHDRRALSVDEFSRLVDAASAGPEIVCISGPDRAMMYILAAWTGYRKGEIGSLTRRSLRLDADPPTVTVAAAYSKRRRRDTQVLHPELAARLQAWLATKVDFPDDALLFVVSSAVPGGVERRTSRMMRKDLAAARKAWIEGAETAKERAERERSDFLKYQDSEGKFADFHSNRHTFITNLELAGVSPRAAQTLARHCDIRLTMGVYTHIGLHDQTTAIERLPAPPGLENGQATPGSANGAADKNSPNGTAPRPEVIPGQLSTPIKEIGQLDAAWATLPDNIKSSLLALVNVAIQQQQGSVSSM